ncbi:MAG: hypothetical protein RSD67_04365 [Oscillospiraceae bacterium]
MDLIQIICDTPLSHPCSLKYKGMAFDGCYYYLTCPDCCEIIKYDLNFCEVETIKTSKPYTCICFDLLRNCFWAGSIKCPHKLFQIDICFREIDCISIPYCENFSGILTAVSYDCIRNGLLICCTTGVIFINPDIQNEYEIMQKSSISWNMGAVSVSPSYIIIEAQNTKQFICVYDNRGKLFCKYAIPAAYVAEAILFSPCTTYCIKQPQFYLLVTKNGCYTHLLTLSLPNCNMDICHCNYDICDRDCEPIHPCPTPKDVCADLMESVALIEAALSHILNAEGEKIQKIVATSDDVDKILCVNKSIQETIVNATHLEIILIDKLNAIKKCCDICDCQE